MRAALAEADPNTSVSETTYLGRPAWTASVDIYPWGVERRVIVDQATGLLLAIDLVDGHPPDEQLVRVLRVTRLEVDPDLPADWQVVPLLEKARAFTRSNYFEDDGTRFGSPESVAKRAAPTPLADPTVGAAWLSPVRCRGEHLRGPEVPARSALASAC